MNPPVQGEFAFDASPGRNRESAWHRERQEAVRTLAEKLGLPLEQLVEVRLLDGVILQGRLRVREETLFLDRVDTANIDLAIGRATFRHGDIKACVRLDPPP
ncbi:MAG: hypothetical protein HS113_12560 [Verrucomicrobiales bacterium]|nr:hypothetical protein [Verrucomicrobiales bacterium]